MHHQMQNVFGRLWLWLGWAVPDTRQNVLLCQFFKVSEQQQNVAGGPLFVLPGVPRTPQDFLSLHAFPVLKWGRRGPKKMGQGRRNEE